MSNQEKLAMAIQNERTFIDQQFSELLQQLNMLCIENENIEKVLQKIVEQIPGIQDLLSQMIQYNLQVINSDFFNIIDSLLSKCKAFRNDIYYFAALLHNLFRQDVELGKNGQLLQQMMDGLITSLNNLQQMNGKYSKDIAIQKSYNRNPIRSPGGSKTNLREPEPLHQTPTLNKWSQEKDISLDNLALKQQVIKTVDQPTQNNKMKVVSSYFQQHDQSSAQPQYQMQQGIDTAQHVNMSEDNKIFMGMFKAAIRSLPADYLYELLSDEQKELLRLLFK